METDLFYLFYSVKHIKELFYTNFVSQIAYPLGISLKNPFQAKKSYPSFNT